MATTELQSLVTQLQSNMCRVVLGKPDAVRMCLVALLSGEHILLEDVHPADRKFLIGH